MGQGSSKESYKNAVKKLSSIELANIEAVFNEISTKREDGTRHVELSLINRQDFAERFRLPGFIAERLFHAFDRNEVEYLIFIVLKSCHLLSGSNDAGDYVLTYVSYLKSYKEQMLFQVSQLSARET